ACVYLLGREILKAPAQAVAASITFAATPACFAFSASTGTDISAALFAALGGLGIASGNGMLAAGGLAMAAQIRLELIVLAPLILFADRVVWKWKVWLSILAVPAIVHIGWVLSIAPALVKVEHVQSAFSPLYVPHNLGANLHHLLDPRIFPIAVTVIAI